MDAVTEPVREVKPRKRWLSVTPAIEFAVLAVAIAVAVATYAVVSGQQATERLISSPLVAFLLIANILPCTGLLVLIGRRVALRRAARSATGSGGRLHVRLVAIFSALASVPTILVVVFASLIVQYGIETWFSDRARGMLENATALARENYSNELNRITRETETMRGDIQYIMTQEPIESKQFWADFGYQILRRELSEAAIVRITPKFGVQSIVLVNPYDLDLEKIITPDIVKRLNNGEKAVSVSGQGHVGVVIPFNPSEHIYMYSSRLLQDDLGLEVRRGEAILADYKTLQQQSRSLQLKLNAALLALSLLIVGLAVFIALKVADRLVQPLDELVGAVHKIGGGDLTARVPEPKVNDEFGALGKAFNGMTERLEEQTGALESRRALIEAVMSGVTAGVISIDSARNVRLVNASAMAMLAQDEGAVGQPLSAIAPDLDGLLNSGTREAVVEVTVGSEARTLAVKVTRDEAGQVLTFDDITQQLLDQRRAAWSDVARRIAHEIKNPLTPIQLAAERLQRRYGKTIDAADGTFARLTDTIVRQVGDLRRIVDEFSSFARMPKPLFREESLLDIGRQAMFLHEVAHPAIRFEVDAPDNPIVLVSDRRQIGQALTNVVKNAVEAIEARGEGQALPQGEIVMTLHEDQGKVALTLADNGIGLPVERDRIVEPYMTTRARGTGLGLAIVKKIIEEHSGTITFGDRPGGGTIVTICFDTQLLANMLGDADADAGAAEPRRPALTRTGNTKS
jgi:two-component system nitrogen regulation sensor histidine kinase NtrY